jgi:hypothetical protein
MTMRAWLLDQLLGMRQRKRTEHECAENGEDGCCRSDAHGEDDYCNGGEARAAEKDAKGVDGVVAERSHGCVSFDALI